MVYQRACLLAPLNFTYYLKLQVIPTSTEPAPPSLLHSQGQNNMHALCRQTDPKDRSEGDADVHVPGHSQTHKPGKSLIHRERRAGRLKR